jgi:hypothetical protein
MDSLLKNQTGENSGRIYYKVPEISCCDGKNYDAFITIDFFLINSVIKYLFHHTCRFRQESEPIYTLTLNMALRSDPFLL